MPSRIKLPPLIPKSQRAPSGTTQDQIDAIVRALRREEAEIQDFLVTDPSGKPLAWIGSRTAGSRRFSGGWFGELYVGANSPESSPFWVDNAGVVVVGKNGYIELRDLDNIPRGWIGVRQEPPIAVTSAVDNGSGLIRLGFAAPHGWSSKDTVSVSDVGGVPAATGRWMIVVSGPNTIDLQGSAFAGLYTSGGLCSRFYSGLLTEQFALGTSFDTAKLRMFADGSLDIKDASIRVQSGTVVVEINTTSAFSVSDAANDIGVEIRTITEAWYGGTAGLRVFNPNDESDNVALLSKSDLTFYNGGLVYGETSYGWSGIDIRSTSLLSTGGLSLKKFTGAFMQDQIALTSLDGNIWARGSVNAVGGFLANYVPGIDKTITHLSAAPTSVTINFKDHSGTNQTVVVSAPITTTTSRFNKGIITDLP